jgi:hypothetical protein
MDNLMIFAERNFLSNRISIRLGQRVEGGVAEALPVTFVSVEQGSVSVAPCLDLHPNDAQALIDQLWHVGFRPSEGSGSAGALAATERHLEDMRTLVFKESK